MIYSACKLLIRMSADKQTGLSSLSAAYTDSEGEDEVENISPLAKSITGSATGSPGGTPAKTGAAQKPQLVAYGADGAADEEEEDNRIAEDMDISDDESDKEMAMEKEVLPAPSPPKTFTKRLDDGILPPEPSGHCSKALQDKINEYYKMMREGVDMTKKIESKKEYRNPSLYEKLIQFCNIRELDTNYPPNLYNPDMYGPESYYEELAKTQKQDMDKREKERREKTRIEVLSGTKKVSSIPLDDDLKKRKSKWDQVGSGGLSVPLKPAGVLPIKSTTVINAFGSLSKIKAPK